MKAERAKRAVVLEAQGYRQSQIERAEGDKQAKILQAEGDLEAARREAEARERLALAEANATDSVALAINRGGRDAVNYFVALKYTEALGDFARSPKHKTVFRSEERRVGKQGVSTFRSRWSPLHKKTKTHNRIEQ